MLGSRLVVCVALVASLVGCGGSDDEPETGPTPAPSTTTPTAAPAQEDTPDAAEGLAVSCSGTGDPTVVLIAGLNTSGDVFAPLAGRLSATTRVCTYDRAGIGASPALAADAPDPSPGRAAADLHEALAAQDLAAPYVVLGWSYGGLVAQAFTDAFPDDVAGLVLEDTSVLSQFTDPDVIAANAADGVVWAEGGRDIDQDAVVDELTDLHLDAPTVVLSQDVSEDWAAWWYRSHDQLAQLSGDAVHVIGTGSGHEMHVDVPDLVAAAVTAAVTTAQGGAPVAPCDERYTSAGGRCRPA